MRKVLFEKLTVTQLVKKSPAFLESEHSTLVMEFNPFSLEIFRKKKCEFHVFRMRATFPIHNIIDLVILILLCESALSTNILVGTSSEIPPITYLPS